uniref:WRC domain-containing protein n=1 Tax=Arundo donax TaxID=35708 RepID=A0A0A9GJA6_ARUDO
MRIRKSASRLLSSAYSVSAAPAPDAAPPFELPSPPPPPPPRLAPCSAPEYCHGAGLPTASGVPCELSRSPWDLIAELSISDPQVEDDLVDKYFVNVTGRASWLFSASMPAASPKEKLAVAAAGDNSVQKKPPKKAAVSKENENKECASQKANVKKEEDEDGAPRVWKCKKNDGKRWHCHRTVSRPNTLCKYHFEQKRSYLNPEFALEVVAEASLLQAPASKPTSSKPGKKKPSDDSGATEGFYYYAGFGPFRSKRHCRSTLHDFVPAPKQEEEEQLEDASPPNQAQTDDDATNIRAAARYDGVSSCDNLNGIAGLDEESSDDNRLGTPGCNMNGNGEHRVGNDDSKRKNPWKRWRKPVKARSLNSLM